MIAGPAAPLLLALQHGDLLSASVEAMKETLVLELGIMWLILEGRLQNVSVPAVGLHNAARHIRRTITQAATQRRARTT